MRLRAASPIAQSPRPQALTPMEVRHATSGFHGRASQGAAAAGDRRVRRPLRPQGRAPRQLPEGHPEREGRRGAVEAALGMAEEFARGADAPPDASVIAAIDASRGVAGGPAGSAEAAAAAAEAAHAAAAAWRRPRAPVVADKSAPEELKTAEARNFLGGLDRTSRPTSPPSPPSRPPWRPITAVGYHNEDFVDRGPRRLRQAAPPEARPLPGAGRADRPVAGRAARPPLSREPSVDRPEWTHEGLVDDPREDRRIP